MSNILDGFTGKVPSGVSIKENIRIALDATKNMSAFEKAQWLREQIGPNKIWDYKKTIGSEYENFGNFNYGVVAKALFNKEMVLAAAGGAQYSSEKGYTGSLYIGTAISLFYGNQDDEKDIPFVEAGIQLLNHTM